MSERRHYSEFQTLWLSQPTSTLHQANPAKATPPAHPAGLPAGQKRGDAIGQQTAPFFASRRPIRHLRAAGSITNFAARRIEQGVRPNESMYGRA